jgi:pyrophosphatase PpaX
VNSVVPPALLFDLDGTLVDTIELIISSARFAFADFEGTRPTDDDWRALIGRPLTASIREFAKTEAEADRIFKRYREYQLLHHDNLVRAFDGMVDALKDWHEAGHQMAVVTSKSDWLARKGLELVGVSDLFPVLVGCDTCVNHKPHPEPVERALTQLGRSPDDAIFVGDSPHDIESGKAAGVYTIGVTWGAFTGVQMRAAGADVVVDDLGSLRREIEGFSNRDGFSTL